MKRLAPVLLAAALLPGTFPPAWAVAQGTNSASAPATEATWIAVARGIVEPPGGLIRLAAQREGLIAEVMVEEGDKVRAGQALARIDDATARLQLETAGLEVTQAETQRDLARLRHDHATSEAGRLAPLAKADALPARQMQEASHSANLSAIELQVAEQAVAMARQRLLLQQQEIEARILRAPVDGVIVRRTARPGDGTSTSTVTEMFLLAPDGPRLLRAQLDEQFVGLVSPGQKAKVVRERDDGQALDGTVLRVAPVFGGTQAALNAGGEEARTVEITIRLDGPQQDIARLVLGQRMMARIEK